MQLYIWITTGSALGGGARFFVSWLGAVWLGQVVALFLNNLKV